MIKKSALYFFFVSLSTFLAPAWADSGSDCVYEHSDVDVQKFKKSRHVVGFEKLKRNNGSLAAGMGMTDISVQIIDADGMSLLVFGFHGG